MGVAHWVRKIEGKELVYLNFKSRPSAASPAGHSISASGSGPASLAGKMAMYNPLLGPPWTCATQLSTPGAQPQQQTSTVSFTATSQNVLHIEVSSPQFAAHSFVGFDSKSNQYWRTEMGVFGGIMRETSADGTNFSGKSTMGETWEPVRSVLTTVQADGSSSDTEWTRNGIELTFTSRCMR